MYAASFNGSRAKLRQAEKHIKTLEAYIKDFFESDENRATLRADLDVHSGYHLIRLETVPDLFVLQEEVGLLAGDVIHNLRSALDHIAWQLACVHTAGNPRWPRRVQFPIEDGPTQFQARCAEGDRGSYLGEVDPVHQALIEEFQPYRGGPSVQFWSRYVHELVLIRELSVEDKHRVLLTIKLPSTSFETFFRWVYTPDGLIDEDRGFEMDHRFEPGAKVMLTRLAPGPLLPKIEPHMNVVGYARPGISLEMGGPVVPDLRRMAAYVEAVVERFEKEFP